MDLPKLINTFCHQSSWPVYVGVLKHLTWARHLKGGCILWVLSYLTQITPQGPMLTLPDVTELLFRQLRETRLDIAAADIRCAFCCNHYPKKATNLPDPLLNTEIERRIICPMASLPLTLATRHHLLLSSTSLALSLSLCTLGICSNIREKPPVIQLSRCENRRSAKSNSFS